ncbi:MAG TPA: hypothetical protein VN326_11820 [Casimicrobiaceae bacterium]|jgi:hypothetical protein|nr:hypothetical protein [Casimicrobiaceae bacterium]
MASPAPPEHYRFGPFERETLDVTRAFVDTNKPKVPVPAYDTLRQRNWIPTETARHDTRETSVPASSLGFS